MTIMKTKDGFELQTCSRCGGSGQYSYCQMHGSTCFGCGGSGKTLTKRGRAALQMYEDSLKVPLASLKIGDLMRVEDLSRRYFAPVIEVGEPGITGSYLKDGVMVPSTTIAVTTEHAKYGRSGLIAAPETMVRKGWTAEEKAPRRIAALQYQNAKGRK